MSSRIVAIAAAKFRVAALCSLVITGLVVAGSGSAQPFDYGEHVSDREVVYLSLNAMASLPGARVFLGGSYRTASDPIHTCLLISKDGGESWADVPIKLEDSGIRDIATMGTNHLWALATRQKEGTDDPAFVVRSSDAGESWEAFPLPTPTIGGIVGVQEFRFFDELHGLLSVESSVGEGTVYSTRDGGQSWELMWITSPTELEHYRYPTEPRPLHATLWRQDNGSHQAAGLLRLVQQERETFGWYVQRYSVPSEDWENVVSIRRTYRVEDGRLGAIVD